MRLSLIFGIAVACGVRAQAEVSGQQLYESNCAGCHGLDARGGEHGPNIATIARVQQMSDTELARTIRSGIPGAGMPAFGSRLNSEQLSALTIYVRTLQGKPKTGPLPGNPEAGRALFFGKAGCFECHAMIGKGGFIAADLSSYAITHGADEIREAIVNPNSGQDPRHGFAVIITRDGEQYTGAVRNEDNFSIQLQSRDGAFHLFEKSTLASVTRKRQSIMPGNYGSKLSSSELNDLVGYLMQLAARQPKRAQDDSEW